MNRCFRLLPLAVLGGALLLTPACRTVESDPPLPLRIGTYSSPAGFDPHLFQDLATRTVLSNLYESLVALDVEMRGQPALAVSWSSPDDKTWRFDLRPGVTFHDGSPFGADDVVFSFERARHHPDSRFASHLTGIDQIRRIDDSTVEITTTGPEPLLLNRLAFVLIVPDDSPETIEQPIGTGPYRLARSAEDGVWLEAHENYWNGPPPIEEAEFRVVSESATRLASIQRGDLDIAIHLKSEDVAVSNPFEGIDIRTADELRVTLLILRLDRPPLDDLRVREALDRALDRNALVDRLRSGYGAPTGQLVGPQVFGFDDKVLPIERDVEGARLLLTQAGFEDGVSFTLDYWRDSGPLIVEQARAAGITIEARRNEVGSEFLQRLSTGDFQAAWVSWVADTGDASTLAASLVHSADPQRAFGDSNWAGYSSPEVDHWIESAADSPNLEVRRSLLQQALRRFVEDRAVLPLFSTEQIHAVRSDLEWAPRLDGVLLVADVRPRDQDH